VIQHMTLARTCLLHVRRQFGGMGYFTNFHMLL
jgi:hypothetical protein